MASCQSGKQATPAIDRTNFDESVALNEDFYQYATGGWQAKNPLKPEFARYGVFDVMRENNEIRINELFAQMTKSVVEYGNIEQKISDLYKMGLDEARLNKEGAKPIKKALKEIFAMKSREELIASLAELHTDGIGVFFAAYPAADLADSNMTIFYLEQGGLGMGNRDYYLDEENAAKRTGYTEWLTKAFTMLGWGDAAAKAEQVLAFETKMAKAFRSNVELRDVAANYNPMSKADFEKRYNNFAWGAYLAEMGIGSFDKIIVGQPEVLDTVFN